MFLQIRKHIVILMMGILLYPIVQKDVHDYLHSDDFHCTSKTEKHLHQPPHFCLICNLIIHLPYIPKNFNSDILKDLLIIIKSITISAPIPYNLFIGFSFSLRAPPLL
jgi:hypothetical protein